MYIITEKPPCIVLYCILCSEAYARNVSVWQRDVSGCVLSLTAKFGTFKTNLVNLYAPTVPSERKTFFQMAPSFFFPNTWPLVGGDLNGYDSVFDKFGGAPSLDSVFKGFKSGRRLGDALRFKNPREKQFRLGFDIFPCTYSDHDFVILNLDFRDRINREPRVFGNLIIRYLMMYFSTLRLFN